MGNSLGFEVGEPTTGVVPDDLGWGREAAELRYRGMATEE